MKNKTCDYMLDGILACGRPWTLLAVALEGPIEVWAERCEEHRSVEDLRQDVNVDKLVWFRKGTD